MAKPNHPLKVDGKSWDKQKVIGELLPRLEQQSLADALAAGYTAPDGKTFGMPTPYTIGQWADMDPQLAAAIARARELRAHHLAEEALAISDQEPPRTARGELDRGHIRWMERRANQRQWLAERLNPKQYGAKTQVDVHHHGSIDIAQVLHDARHRVIEGKAERIVPALDVPDDAGDLFD